MTATIQSFQITRPNESDPIMSPMSPISRAAENSHQPKGQESEPHERTSRQRPSERAEAKQTLQHILTDSGPTVRPPSRSQSQMSKTRSPVGETPSKQPIIWIDGEVGPSEDQLSTQNDSYTRASEFNPSHTMTVAHTRRNANGTIGSVYSGNKIRHLKKEDGIPLWRKDIQLEFLRCVFEDNTPCFTKAFDGTKEHTFADIYVDAMARSSKTSKILKEKLLSDRAGAMSMAMICLLVNVGRMNTTLNFFPEMRAQLRTYHAIPSLQANQDPNAYKQLQDAPRLKSILKGASEDMNQPNTIDRIKAAPVPRTNPVNLIFVLSQYAPKVSETHFHPPRDFFDLVMRGTLSSKSRAKAFLWLIWWYLESDFTAEAALHNPFGPGQPNETSGGLPLIVPAFEHLTEEQANAENVDTESEITYGEMKRVERRRILEEDETVGPPLKKARRANDDGVIAISDTDPTRSPSPNSAVQRKSSMDYNHPNSLNGRADDSAHPTARYPTLASKSDPSNPHRILLKTRLENAAGSSPPAHPSSGHSVLGSSLTNGHRRSRPETSHQKAVNMNRRMRIDHILHKQMQSEQSKARRDKKRVGSSLGMMVMDRVRNLPEMYDSEEENSWGPGGLLPNEGEQPTDYGEEAIRHKKVIDRAWRRLLRGENEGSSAALTKGYRRRKRKGKGIPEEDEDLGRLSRKRKRASNNGARERRSQDDGFRDESLDDLDLDLLKENREDDDSVNGASELEAGVTEEEMWD